MWDADVSWCGDLSVSPTGGLLLTSGVKLGQQRVLRRLLTGPKEYIWQPSYGAGFGMLVGRPVSARSVAGIAYRQLRLEAAVAQQPAPVVSEAGSTARSVVLSIKYADAGSGQTQILSVPIGT